MLIAVLAMLILTAECGGRCRGRAIMAIRAVVRRMPAPSRKSLDEEQTGQQIGQDYLHSFTTLPLTIIMMFIGCQVNLTWCKISQRLIK
jgi:hypothetical protein